MRVERRSTTQQADGLTVSIPFNSLSEDLDGFRERIAPGAFDRTLKSDADVLAFWNHDYGKPLGRRSAGTLDLAADADKLTARIAADDTSWSEDARAAVQSGSVQGSSFGFIALEDRWDRVNGDWQRTVLDADLIEISPTPIPAYSASTAAAG